MGLLTWDKPEKVMSTEAWMAISADGAPPGVYVPNMSEEDRLRWKAKLIGKKGAQRVEIRKGTTNGTQIKVNVTFEVMPRPVYTNFTAPVDADMETRKAGFAAYDKAHKAWLNGGREANVRISMNGPAFLTFTEFGELDKVVEEAKVVLASLV